METAEKVLACVLIIIFWALCGRLCAFVYNQQLDRDQWQCSESVLEGDEHRKRSECIQYGRIK